MAYHKSDPNEDVIELLDDDDDVTIVIQKKTNPDIAVHNKKGVRRSHVKEYIVIDSDDECHRRRHHRNKQDVNDEVIVIDSRKVSESLQPMPSSGHAHEKKRKNDNNGSLQHIPKRNGTIPNHGNGDVVRTIDATLSSPEQEIKAAFPHLDIEYIRAVVRGCRGHTPSALQHIADRVLAANSETAGSPPSRTTVVRFGAAVLPQYEILDVFPHLDIEYIRTVLKDCHNDASTALSYIAENVFATNSVAKTKRDIDNLKRHDHQQQHTPLSAAIAMVDRLVRPSAGIPITDPYPRPLPPPPAHHDRGNKPIHWSDTDQILVEVSPSDDEYWIVDEKLKRDMKNANISKLFRLQNRSLWMYYNFHKERFTNQSIEHNEKDVWHGTKDIDPSIIYRDQMDGFMMQFAQVGSYGRGIYFAEQSSYSHNYSFPGLRTAMAGAAAKSAKAATPPPPPPDRPILCPNEQEIFLAKLLVGTSISLPKPDKTLLVPPMQPGGTKNDIRRYNTVIGQSCGSPIYVVYENGRAYPSYLVRYYIGPRDRKRTPYASRELALLAKEEIEASHM